MESEKILSTKEKALAINFDPTIYGSFAEIGAGQEVAANFFKSGGASGTIAKTMSAYDMAYSDAIYGKIGRYVCEERLMAMLNKEMGLLNDRLAHRIKDTKFFSFANTVETLNYARTNRGHGWVGCKFQLAPESKTNECVFHVILKDQDASWQQEALGKIGVNLIYACHFIRDPEKFLLSLADGFRQYRIEIDMFRLEGPDFSKVDNRLMSLNLVKHGFTRAAMFGRKGNVLMPSEALYKKNVLILRGRFRPVTHVNVDMLFCGRKRFKKEEDVDNEKIVVLTELTLQDLKIEGDIHVNDFMNRVDLLCSLGQNVLISNYTEYYRLVRHITRLNKDYKVGLILGIYNLHNLFEEKYYTNLKGGLLEAFGILFGRNVKFYVYPSLKRNSNDLYSLENFEVSKNQKNMLNYLLDNKKLESVTNVSEKNLRIISDNVLNMIKDGTKGWEEFVPSKVASEIKKKNLFSYKPQDVTENIKNEVKKITL